MTQEPDEALRWARENVVDAKLHEPIAHGYRVGQTAAKARIEELKDMLRQVQRLYHTPLLDAKIDALLKGRSA